MRSFQAAATTSQPVLCNEDITSIFYKIPELHHVHMTFIQQLEPKIKAWSPDQEVASAFKIMVCRVPHTYLQTLLCHEDIYYLKDAVPFILVILYDFESGFISVLFIPILLIGKNNAISNSQ